MRTTAPATPRHAEPCGFMQERAPVSHRIGSHRIGLDCSCESWYKTRRHKACGVDVDGTRLSDSVPGLTPSATSTPTRSPASSGMRVCVVYVDPGSNVFCDWRFGWLRDRASVLRGWRRGQQVVQERRDSVRTRGGGRGRVRVRSEGGMRACAHGHARMRAAVPSPSAWRSPQSQRRSRCLGTFAKDRGHGYNVIS